MRRTEFERCTPESVGIDSREIDRLLTALEGDHTEMHGIMIMRHGRICAEGWWAPYAPGLRHGLQSLSKTYAATAVGIACTEGVLDLDERVIDIFPEEAPEEPDEWLSMLKVRDVLCMGCGMDEMPTASEHWISDFLHTPVRHQPGTTFMYNSMGSTLLGAIVRKKTGLGLQDYLKPRLFDKIGIDAENLRWFHTPDGMEVGGGGLFATTEDNLRLMKLYMDGGVWEDERILSEDYVRQAISIQNDSSSEKKVNPPATDNFLGYGFQIWMCKPKGAYRADGAMGQFAICVPSLDMILSINETAIGAEGVQKTLDLVWEFLEKIHPETASLPENPEASRALARRMRHLSICHPDYTPYRSAFDTYSGTVYRLTEGTAAFETNMIRDLAGGTFSEGFRQFSFRFSTQGVQMELLQDGEFHLLQIATDGTRAWNRLSIIGEPEEIVLMSGHYVDDTTFCVTAKWPETCFTKRIYFRFAEESCEMEIETMPFCAVIPGGTIKAASPQRALAVAIQL